LSNAATSRIPYTETARDIDGGRRLAYRPSMDRRRFLLTSLAGIGGLIALGGIDLAAAQSQAEVAKLLRVEWEPGSDKWGPPRLVGHIYNDSTYRIGSVRLRLEVLDGSNQVVRETLAWIYVSVPARSREYFSVRRPPGEAFRLTVESFVLIARERIEETP
jgi:hypothetical protein